MLCDMQEMSVSTPSAWISAAAVVESTILRAVLDQNRAFASRKGMHKVLQAVRKPLMHKEADAAAHSWQLLVESAVFARSHRGHRHQLTMVQCLACRLIMGTVDETHQLKTPRDSARDSLQLNVRQTCYSMHVLS